MAAFVEVYLLSQAAVVTPSGQAPSVQTEEPPDASRVPFPVLQPAADSVTPSATVPANSRRPRRGRPGV